MTELLRRVSVQIYDHKINAWSGEQGWFHCWGLSDDEQPFSVAIIELDDGSVEIVIPTRLKFVSPYK